MRFLGASLALCTLLTLSRAGPIVPIPVPIPKPNSTMPNIPRHSGLCLYIQQHTPNIIGMFIPQCDPHGNFLPQQCSGSTGYCWCVDVYSGEEIPNTKTPPGAVPVNCDGEFYCPYEWSRFGKRCFYFVDSPKTWVEAESYCMFEGANLASVHSYAESHFVQSLTKVDHDFLPSWLGGHDAIYPCFWMWSDGSKFDYTNWYMEPKMERMEHCLKMNYGYNRKWIYASCNETLPFVCSKNI